jgi:hypothetical protein
MHEHIEGFLREPRDLFAGTENMLFQKIRLERRDGNLHDIQPGRHGDRSWVLPGGMYCRMLNRFHYFI